MYISNVSKYMIWKEKNDKKAKLGYIYGKYGDIKFTNKTKVAAFDLDHTVIKPTGGKKFSESDMDWEMYDDSVVGKIRSYHKSKYKIVIVSNQGGISKGKTDKELWKSKLQKVQKELNMPMVVLASLYTDLHRKPRTGLWDKYIKCDTKKSFYCGDAGGLPKRKIKGKLIKKDFSDSDLKFAHNIGVAFMHRDEFIWKKVWDTPVNYLDFDKITKDEYLEFEPTEEQEMIINVGYAGSGKSFYTKHYVEPEGYVVINRDTLGTIPKCKRACIKAIKEGKSVVIDNTNPSVKARSVFLDIANQHKIYARCLYFNTNKELSVHNNIYRHVMTKGKTKIVPAVAYNIFKSKLEIPTKKEGYYEVDTIEFCLDEKEIDKNIYYSYLS